MLNFTNFPDSNIIGSYKNSTGILEFQGIASEEFYMVILRSVTFKTNLKVEGKKTISFQISNDERRSNTFQIVFSIKNSNEEEPPNSSLKIL